MKDSGSLYVDRLNLFFNQIEVFCGDSENEIYWLVIKSISNKEENVIQATDFTLRTVKYLQNEIPISF